jgi:hypothetical protein
MEGVFSSQLAELEKNGLMVDGIHHRFTFFNKVHLFCIHSLPIAKSIETAAASLRWLLAGRYGMGEQVESWLRSELFIPKLLDKSAEA